MSTTVNIPTVDVIGTTTNNNAAAGEIGEYISAALARASAISLTTSTPDNIVSISLTPGDWDVGAIPFYVIGATTVANWFRAGWSVVSATLPGVDSGHQSQDPFSHVAGSSSFDCSLLIPTYRLSLATTTTVYLVVDCSFGVSTMAAYGQLWARRVR